MHRVYQSIKSTDPYPTIHGFMAEMASGRGAYGFMCLLALRAHAFAMHGIAHLGAAFPTSGACEVPNWGLGSTRKREQWEQDCFKTSNFYYRVI